MRVVGRLLALVAAAIVMASPASAQQRATISGKVLDPDGLALPGQMPFGIRARF